MDLKQLDYTQSSLTPQLSETACVRDIAEATSALRRRGDGQGEEILYLFLY